MTKFKRLNLVIMLLTVVVLSGCSFGAMPAGLGSTASPTLPPTTTSVPTASFAPTPSQIPSPQPTNTSTLIPSIAATPSPAPSKTKDPIEEMFRYGRLEANRETGFSFHYPMGLEAKISQYGIDLYRPGEPETYYFWGDIHYPDSVDVTAVDVKSAVNDFLEHIPIKEMKFTEEIVETFGDKEVLTTIIYGELETGSYFVTKGYFIPHDDNQGFTGITLQISNTEQELDISQSEIEEMILSTLHFFPELGADSTCEVSTDYSYGTVDNPIKVAGGVFGGPSREIAFLDTLASPFGNPITYTRLGSFEKDGVILDEYQVFSEGVESRLYIDMYNFTEPMAPAGFICTSSFPIGELP